MTRPAGPPGAAIRLRVVSFNIHGGRPAQGSPDLRGTAGVLRSLAPDLAGLQEVHRWMPPPGIFEDQPRRLRRLLARPLVFRRSFGTGVTGYGNAVVGPCRPHRVCLRPLGGPGEPRSLLCAWFRLGGRELCFMTTHFGLSRRARLRQAAGTAEEVRRCGLPVVLAGDLNTEPGSEEMELLLAAGLQPALPAGVVTFPATGAGASIDHILVSPEFEVTGAGVHPAGVSDHHPVAADLRLRDGTARSSFGTAGLNRACGRARSRP